MEGGPLVVERDPTASIGGVDRNLEGDRLSIILSISSSSSITDGAEDVVEVAVGDALTGDAGA